MAGRRCKGKLEDASKPEPRRDPFSRRPGFVCARAFFSCILKTRLFVCAVAQKALLRRGLVLAERRYRRFGVARSCPFAFPLSRVH